MAHAGSTAQRLVTSTPSHGASSERLHAMVASQHAFVWRTLRRLGVPDADVDDASQQVFLVIHRRLPAIAPVSERSFLFQTTLRVASQWRRAHMRRREQPGLNLVDVADDAANQEELIDQRRARAMLDRALSSMPLKLRAVFVLFELEELTMLEIATISDLRPGTVASRLRRARQHFKQAMAALTVDQYAPTSVRGLR
jgi:RNA polymerase sigma-70 factor (ECF subfamily)